MDTHKQMIVASRAGSSGRVLVSTKSVGLNWAPSSPLICSAVTPALQPCSCQSALSTHTHTLPPPGNNGASIQRIKSISLSLPQSFSLPLSICCSQDYSTADLLYSYQGCAASSSSTHTVNPLITGLHRLSGEKGGGEEEVRRRGLTDGIWSVFCQGRGRQGCF